MDVRALWDMCSFPKPYCCAFILLRYLVEVAFYWFVLDMLCVLFALASNNYQNLLPHWSLSTNAFQFGCFCLPYLVDVRCAQRARQGWYSSIFFTSPRCQVDSFQFRLDLNKVTFISGFGSFDFYTTPLNIRKHADFCTPVCVLCRRCTSILSDLSGLCILFGFIMWWHWLDRSTGKTDWCRQNKTQQEQMHATNAFSWMQMIDRKRSCSFQGFKIKQPPQSSLQPHNVTWWQGTRRNTRTRA